MDTHEYKLGYLATKHLDITEVTKLMRAEIKNAIAKGLLPKGLKTSVRLDRFSGGKAIRLTVTAAPFAVMNEARIAYELNHPHTHVSAAELPYYSDEATRVLKVLKQIHGAYNFDKSDIQSDYFHVRYYGDASYDYRIEYQERDAFKARRAA